ncbi:transmembrane protein 192-like isoform X2 [Lingula anatina]|uniref:Transmembrane protein 192 n=1 Tax=Lingula anatina TaxID=7574 RepID=A0A1S3JU65_LINAN|nr:transmembrane protein 192-like isoform X1 [Lingula anatina]XP_013413873.1 transmembrane protein 192-like isoform X2 [Lingula anatina]|eukprot:XP_013413872.1 transmembrane protein 192-like isoform X1 [Lingula anatina]
MVSLGDQRRQGGVFFDRENSINYDSDDPLLDSVVLSADYTPPFYKIPITWALALELLIMVGIEVITFVVPLYCPPGDGKDDPPVCGLSSYAITIYTHACTWFVFLLFDRYKRHHHNVNRYRGYLEFYRKTRNIRRAPLLISSGAHAMLTVLVMLLQDYCHSDTACSSLHLTRTNFLQIAVSIEVAVMLPCIIVHIVHTVRFNRQRAPPDVQREDMSSYLHSHSDTGFREEDYLDEVLEKQADMIKYLKQHNANLGKKILQLTRQLNDSGSRPVNPS